MASLLNFVTIRNPRVPDQRELETGFVRYPPDLGADLLTDIAAALRRGDGFPAVRRLVADFRSSDRFLDTPAEATERLGALADLAGWLAARAATLTWAQVTGWLRDHPVEASQDQRRLLWENLLAYVYGGGQPEVRELVIGMLCGLHLVDVAGTEETRRDDDALARRLVQATVLVPADCHVRFPDQPPDGGEDGPGDDPGDTHPGGGTGLASGSGPGPEASQRLAELERAHEELVDALDAAAEQARTEAVEPPTMPVVDSGCIVTPETPAATERAVPAAPEPPRLPSLDEATLSRLSPQSRQALEAIGVPTGVRISYALHRVESEALRLGHQVAASLQAPRPVVQVGGAFWMRDADTDPAAVESRRTALARSALTARPEAEYRDFFGTRGDLPRAERPGAETGPQVECQVRPLGVADFRRVEQRLCCYEPGEVAHIENVMEGESKSRTTRHLTTTEQLLTTITEEDTSKQRDTQTTDRFELERETNKVVQTDLSFEMGVNLAAQYGPVKLTADTKFATALSSQESDRQATRYAQEVTDRAVEQVVRKVSEQRSTRTLDEYEETNVHTLKAVDNHVVGLYRWVDKVYEAKVVNYGKRLMFEFLVPEPGAFHLYAAAQAPAEGTLNLKKPVDPRSPEAQQTYGRPPLTSYQSVTETNYGLWAAVYEAVVEPPPTLTITTAKAYHREGMDQTNQFADSKNDFKLADGYEAVSFYASYGLHSENQSGGWNWITVFVGRRSRFANFGGSFSGLLDGEDDVVPVVMMGRTKFYTLSVEVDCRRTPKLFTQWQIKTFNAIVGAYENQLAAYETALAQAKSKVGIEIEGTNPARNRDIERIELERSCLWLLTRCSTLPSEAMHEKGECGYPEFDCCVAIRDGTIVQFFEQLFEWRLMTYLMYPYFWGRKCNWQKIYQLDDVDPLFLAFLQAGYARVVVPVREGYQSAALRYLADGAIWNGGSAPGVDDPMYVAIENEMKESVGTVDPDIKPWPVRVPTTLTVLQCGSGCVEGEGLPCPCRNEQNGKDDGKNGKGDDDGNGKGDDRNGKDDGKGPGTTGHDG